MEVIEDVHSAIQKAQDVVSTTVNGHPDEARNLSYLANMYSLRFLHEENLDDLNESIQITRRAIDIASVAGQDTSTYSSNLALRLNERFLEHGDLNDLEESIEFSHKAVNDTPESGPDRTVYMENLAERLSERYERTGLLSHLTEALEANREVLDNIPMNHPNIAFCLHGVMAQLGARYLRVGALRDLEESIQIGRKIIEIHPTIFPAGHPDEAKYFSNLGLNLFQLSVRTESILHIDESIEMSRNALHIISDKFPDRVAYLDHLANRLGFRYDLKRDKNDLDEAIRLSRECIADTSFKHPRRGAFLNNLAALLKLKHSSEGSAADIDEAIQLLREALRLLAEGSPDYATGLNNLGSHLLQRYGETCDGIDLNEAMDCYQSTLHQTSALPTIRLEAAKRCLECCGELSDWWTAYKISETAMNLIPQLSLRPLSHSDRQYMLTEAAGLASDAAAAALNAGVEPKEALKFLEQGRGVLASSLEEQRADVQELRGMYPELAERWERLREQLDALVLVDQKDRQETWRLEMEENKLNEDLDRLIRDIRGRAEFEDFLRPPGEPAILGAATNGPIIVINVSRFRCDALTVNPKQISSVSLTRLHLADIQEWLSQGNLAKPAILEWLWDVVACPVLNALGITTNPSRSELPRIWWVHTGPLNRFPIHAAGYHRSCPRDTVLDRAVSSYSTSIKAIIQARRHHAKPLSGSALLVGMEQTPGMSRLPAAAKEIEMLSNLCMSIGLQARQPPRRKADILSCFQKCNIFHFAGHGFTDELDPLQSHLLLEDWQKDTLSINDLLDIRLHSRPPFLAYLSACGTGQVKHERHADESIHLLNAFQLAGFRHVIGTMWEVNDEACAGIAKSTYEAIRDADMTDDSVSRGLHEATVQRRNNWLNSIKDTGYVRAVGDQESGIDTASLEASVRDPRDATLCDDGNDFVLDWAQHVHFGP